MLIFKSRRKRLIGITIFLMAAYSLNSVFLSIILSNLITAATLQSMTIFLKYIFVGIAGFLFFTVIGILMVNCKARLLKDLNLSIKETLIKEIITYTDIRDDSSAHLSFMTNDLKQLETKGIEAEFNILSLAFTFCFALLTAFMYDFWIALVFFIGSLMPIVISVVSRSRISKTSHQWMMSNIIYTNRLKDYIAGIETVRTYQVEQQVSTLAIEEAKKMEDSLQTMNVNVETVNQLIYIGVMIFSLLIPFGFGVIRIIQYGVALATFVAIVQLSNSLRNPAIQMIQLLNSYATVKEIKTRYLRAREKDKEKKKVQNNLPSFETLSLKNMKVAVEGKIFFEHVNLMVKRYEKILIVGPSGSGKSTLLRVLQQSMSINEGVYLCNGKEMDGDITEWFSLIRQQPLIFSDTILYNITLGEKYSEKELNEAIALSQLQDVIMDKGLDYQVGERGTHLSIGELQRIEIARALIRQRPIILADEITSSLDRDIANKIRKGLLQSPYTLIEVAHHVDDQEKALYHQIWDIAAL